MNEPSLEAPKRLRRFSPKESNLSSKFMAEPMSPPNNIEARIKRSADPLGSESLKLLDHNGMRAEVAPSRVTRPSTSVIIFCDLSANLDPSEIPKKEPIAIAATLISVPIPTNID
jgi:hypothetical protein